MRKTILFLTIFSSCLIAGAQNKDSLQLSNLTNQVAGMKEILDLVYEKLKNDDSIQKVNKNLTDENTTLKKKLNNTEPLQKEKDSIQKLLTSEKQKIDTINTREKNHIKQEIDSLINKNSQIPKSIINSLKIRAELFNPSNKETLINFIKYVDSVKALTAIFEFEYNAANNKLYKTRLGKLTNDIKSEKKFTGLEAETKKIDSLLDNYCNYTSIVYEKLSKIYKLKSVTYNKDNDALVREIRQLDYWVRDYPFLFDNVKKFITNSDTQEKFKNRTVACNQ